MLISVRMLLVGFALMAFMLAVPHARADRDRIVSADGATTEMLLAMGLEQSLVGVDVTSVLPEGAPELPNVGYHRVLSAEGVMSLNPDILVGSEHMGPEPTIRQLEAAGVKVIRLPASHTIDQLESNILRLSEAVHSHGSGTLIDTLARQKQQLAEENLNGRRGIFLLTAENRLRLSGGGTAGDALLKLTGAENPVEFARYRSVTGEAILAYQPDFILVAGEGQGAEVEALLEQQPLLIHTPAGRSKRIIAVDGRTLVAGIGPGAIREAIRVVERLREH